MSINAIEILITPEQAGAWLQQNTQNRALNALHVRRLAAEMRAGKWRSNGDTICFSDARLIDGQHRLHACVAAGVSFRSLVVFGVDDAVFDTKDIGKRRTHTDALTIHGETSAANISSALAWVHRYAIGDMGVCNYRFSSREIVELLEQHPGIRESTRYMWALKKKGMLMPRSLLTALHYLFASRDRVLSDLFFDSLMTGAHLAEDDPIFQLRARLINNSISKAKLEAAYIAALTIKAWNASVDKRRIKYLRWSDGEQFPVIK